MDAPLGSHEVKQPPAPCASGALPAHRARLRQARDRAPPVEVTDVGERLAEGEQTVPALEIARTEERRHHFLGGTRRGRELAELGKTLRVSGLQLRHAGRRATERL